jgi:hypothetical protein
MLKKYTIPAALFLVFAPCASQADSGSAIRPESGSATRQSEDCRSGFDNCDHRHFRHPGEKDRHRDGVPPSGDQLLPESGAARRERPVRPSYRYDPPRAEDYQHFRISCSQGASILKQNGFTEIQVRDCEGSYYDYTAVRRDYRYAVSVFAQGGRIVSVVPY